MAQLLVMYKTPKDTAAFDKHYSEKHIPLAKKGEVLGLLENWRGASFADVNQQTGFGEPGKGAPHGHEDTRFAAHA